MCKKGWNPNAIYNKGSKVCSLVKNIYYVNSTKQNIVTVEEADIQGAELATKLFKA